MNEKNNEHNNIERLRYYSVKVSKMKKKSFHTFRKLGMKSISKFSLTKEKRKITIETRTENKKDNNIISSQKQPQMLNSIKSNLFLLHYQLCIYEKYANNLLYKKYNCSKKINIIYKKEEIISKYDSFQIQNLIENKKTSLYSRLNDMRFSYNKREYLINIFTQKESKIILKNLLFFVYDKDKMTYNERLVDKIDKDKIKSNLERIIPTLDKKFILMMKKYNKIRNNDDKNELDIYNKKKQNYLPICELSPLDVHNSIPNLFPNDVSIIFILREYIKKNLCQKLLEKEFYYKNIQVNLVSNKSNKSNRFNRSYKSSKESKSKSKTNINNKSFSKSIFNKKNNYINNHKNIRRKKNDMEIFEIEKLIKRFDIKKKKIINKEKFDKNNSSQKIKRKLLFNKIKIDNNNKDKLSEKIHLSQNSTNLTIKKRDQNKSIKADSNTLISSSRFDNSNSSNKKILIKDYFFMKNNKAKMNIKKLYENNSRYNLDNSSLNEISKKNNPYLIKNNYLRKIFFNSEENNNKSQESEYIKNNFNIKDQKLFFPKQYQCKLIQLKDFLKLEKEIKFNIPKSSIKLAKPVKSFEYQNDIYIFSKKLNENVWERGEDINTQIKNEEISKKTFRHLKKINTKSLNCLKKCNTFKKIIGYGDLYNNDISFFKQFV